MEGCRAPYNSISTFYELCGESLVCCTHGTSCDLAGHPPNEEPIKNNVTLADATPTEKEREKLIDNMRRDLQFSDFFAHKRAKKNRKENANKEKEQKKTAIYQVPDEEIFPRKDKPKKKEKNKPPAMDSLETTAALAKEKTFRFKDLYLGAGTFSSAELNITEEVGFRLYHRMPTAEEMDDLEDQAHLYMACRNGLHFRHYPVKVRTVQEAPLYYIDYGDPRAHAYSSLDELVSEFVKKVHFFEHPVPLVVNKNK